MALATLSTAREACHLVLSLAPAAAWVGVGMNFVQTASCVIPRAHAHRHRRHRHRRHRLIATPASRATTNWPRQCSLHRQMTTGGQCCLSGQVPDAKRQACVAVTPVTPARPGCRQRLHPGERRPVLPEQPGRRRPVLPGRANPRYEAPSLRAGHARWGDASRASRAGPASLRSRHHLVGRRMLPAQPGDDHWSVLPVRAKARRKPSKLHDDHDHGADQAADLSARQVLERRPLRVALPVRTGLDRRALQIAVRAREALGWQRMCRELLCRLR